MKKFSTPGLVLIPLVMGLGGGFLAGWRIHQHFSDPIQRGLEIRALEDQGDTVVRALEHLRADSTNPVPFLENRLDEVVVWLGPLLPQVPSRGHESARIVLGHIRDYRTRFPHKSAQGFDGRIAQVFSALDEKH